MKRLLYASLLTALFTTVVHAQPPPLWITGEAGTELHTVDTSTGTATFIGLTGHEGVVVLAFHPNGTLYTFTESITGDPAVPEQLAIFDQLTGEATTIGSPLPERTQIMPGAVGPDGTMFAAGISGSLASKLLVIDLETGQPTVIGPFGVDGMMDFAFDLDGTLVGATGTALYTINTVTGQATKVVDLGGDIGAGWGVMGIHIAADGTLFATDLVFDGEGSSLYRVDRETGVGTRVAYLGMMLAHSADMAPPSAGQRAQRLMTLLATVAGSGGTAQSLLTKLQAASSAIQAGRTPAACGQLSAFRHEVRAFWGRVLTPALARQLDVDALWTETSLGCEGPAVAPMSAASARSGALQLTKECSEYTGLAGSFCTITASSIKEIVVGTRVVYGQSAGAASVDSDVMLDMPGPGNNTAFGHCSVDLATGLGLCTFSGGTGKFTWFTASADVSYAGGASYAWNGMYTFGPRD